MLSRDFVGGLVAVVAGGIYLFFSLQLRTSALADTIGPAGLPKVLGVLMISLGVILCIQSLFTYFKSGKPEISEWQGQGRRIARAFGLLSLGIGYLLLVKSLGYAISIGILLALVALYQGATANWRVVVISTGGAATLWAIFVLLLDVPMPSGIF
ncbi:MAG: putative tricarboxylic transport membrane protein [Gammaproteobacteria bacterium]|jgi:putative tricarboxylic transport membrane protein